LTIKLTQHVGLHQGTAFQRAKTEHEILQGF
jgi:hypothetical protein